MSTDLCLVDLSDSAGEPRVRDLRLAEVLEFSAPRQIRELIQRNQDELERYGVLSCRATNSSDPLGRGRPGTEYWLNEAQALLIAMRSDAPRAADVRADIIAVFQAFRHGHLVPTTEAISQVIDAALRPLAYRTTQIEVKLDQCLHRLTSNRRRNPSQPDVRTIERFAALHNGNCPCCRKCDVVDAHGERINGAEIDHFFAVDQAGLNSTWLICGDCHGRLTRGEMPRKMAAHRFAAYQELLDDWLQTDAGPLFALEPGPEASLQDADAPPAGEAAAAVSTRPARNRVAAAKSMTIVRKGGGSDAT